ncbi:chorismate mutase aro7 [Balamuthia mandrillaris]
MQNMEELQSYWDKTEPLKLEDLRSQLIRQEETIIFALIERAQFHRNPIIYEEGGLETTSTLGGKSFLEFFLCETEKVQSMMRRYTSPDEHAFFPEELRSPVLPLLNYNAAIQPNQININPKVMRVYVEKMVPLICPRVKNDHTEYGSSALCDINALQALSKRIHYGKFVAEAKFHHQRELYTRLIEKNDAEGIMDLLTNKEVEEKVLQRVRAKSLAYGRDIEDEERFIAGPSGERSPRDTNYKVDPDAIVQIYRDFLIPLTKEVQLAYLLQRVNNLRVAYLAPAASYSHGAAQKYFGTTNVKYVGFPSFNAVFEAVLSNKTHYGIVPVENSTTGRVAQTLNIFFESAANVKVCGETYLKIAHSLIRHKDSGDRPVKKIFSHPQALDQCKQWLRINYPDVELLETTSTSKAAELISNATTEEELSCAAIASQLCVREYPNLKIISKDIQDNENNTTRFVVLGKHFGSPSGRDKTLMTFGVRHETGSLSNVLSLFTSHNINLSAIESHPDKSQSWSYNFLVELDGHVEDEHIKSALEELQQFTTFQTIFGSFPEAWI